MHRIKFNVSNQIQCIDEGTTMETVFGTPQTPHTETPVTAKLLRLEFGTFGSVRDESPPPPRAQWAPQLGAHQDAFWRVAYYVWMQLNESK